MKTRQQIYAGNNTGTNFIDESVNTHAEYPKNNSSDGFLKKLFISTTVTAVLTRNIWLRTILYHILDSFIHKTEDRASKTDLGVDVDSTETKFVTPLQLPGIGVDSNNTSQTTTSGDLVTGNQNMFQLRLDNTSTNKIYFLSFSDIGWKWLMERTKPSVGVVKFRKTSPAINMGTTPSFSLFDNYLTGKDITKFKIELNITISVNASTAVVDKEYSCYPNISCTCTTATTTASAGLYKKRFIGNAQTDIGGSGGILLEYDYISHILDAHMSPDPNFTFIGLTELSISFSTFETSPQLDNYYVSVSIFEY